LEHGVEGGDAHRLPLRSFGHEVIGEIHGAEAEPFHRLRDVAQAIELDAAELDSEIHARGPFRVRGSVLRSTRLVSAASPPPAAARRGYFPLTRNHSLSLMSSATSPSTR